MTTARMKMLTLNVVAPVLSVFPLAQALERQGDVGKLPALGWNSWNAFGCNITEDDFINAAQQMVNLGLKVNILRLAVCR